MILTNSQYDMIMSEYSLRQNDVQRELAARTEEIYTALPEYKELRDRISRISLEATTAALRGDRSLLDNLSPEIDKLNLAMSNVLTEAGYPTDYLEPHYFCPKCRDTGYVDSRKCSCFIQTSINLLYKESNLSDAIGDCSFDKFSVDYYPEDFIDSTTGVSARANAAHVLKISKEFVKNFGSGDNLLFYGNTGVGKTFLSNCIARELLDNAHSVLYISANALFDRFSDFENGNTSQIFDCELLIIDDLGTELSNSFTNSKLFECINSRLLSEKSTIISTNLSIKSIMETYSERIFSRLSSSYRLLKLYGDDIRFKKRSR